MCSQRVAVSMGLMLSVGVGISASNAGMICVDDDAALGGDGTCWTSPFKYLQDALAIASPGDEIRVAGGLYKPDQDEAGNVVPGDRAATFRLTSGVSLYGGYAGFADLGAPQARDMNAYPTILSGDLNGDDGAGGPGVESDCCVVHDTPGCDDAACEGEVCAVTPTCCASDWNSLCVIRAAAFCCDLCSTRNDCENSYHVVTTSGTDATALLDGVTITAGRVFGADGEYPMGGGVYNESGRPTLVNCMIVGNTAGAGGGMANLGAGGTSVNCAFIGNTVVDDGGAIFNDMCFPTLTNCTIAGNAGHTAGGIRNYAAVELTLTNCILWGNTAIVASGEDAQIINTASLTTVNYTCLEGWTGILGGVGNIGQDPRFVRDPNPGPDGDWDGIDDDFGDVHLQFGSPCIDHGDNSTVATPTDLGGDPRIIDGDADGTATVDLGAYEFQGRQPIPTVSQWGLMVMTLFVLTAGTIILRMKRAMD